RSYGDWSSDVCSSDLGVKERALLSGGSAPLLVHHQTTTPRTRSPTPASRRRTFADAIGERPCLAVEHENGRERDQPRGGGAGGQIGRASCRERREGVV